MVGQQLQSRLGIRSPKGVDTDWAHREPDRASDRSRFLPSLDLVNPVRSDRLVLNTDGVLHHGGQSVSGKEFRWTSFQYIRIELCRIGDVVHRLVKSGRAGPDPLKPHEKTNLIRTIVVHQLLAELRSFTQFFNTEEPLHPSDQGLDRMPSETIQLPRRSDGRREANHPLQPRGQRLQRRTYPWRWGDAPVGKGG